MFGFVLHSLGGGTAKPGRLHAKLCHALVVNRRFGPLKTVTHNPVYILKDLLLICFFFVWTT